MIPVQDAPIVTSPSITTVESAAAAKVYMETHFNNLLAMGPSSRSLRRRRLELACIERGVSLDECAIVRERWYRAESDYLRQVRILKASSTTRHCTKGTSIAGFHAIRVLGKGSFGVVRLVAERDGNVTQIGYGDPGVDGEAIVASNVDGTATRNLPAGKPLSDVFAMKVIRKSDMLRACQEGHLRAERDFLVNAEGARWVVPLIASFQDNSNLYLLMEYMIGGDFLGLLLREDVLDEAVAKWYVAEMILCVEEAHKMRWIHRDIKPDNFLISASGHLRISDFGLAFDGHWAHSQAYHSNQRQTLLEKLGIHVSGDEEDVAEDEAIATAHTRLKDGYDDDYDEESTRTKFTLTNGMTPIASRYRKPHESEDCAKREGLLNWRNRTERRRLARSVVGTSQYMAPEVIIGQAYDGRCD